MRKFTISLLLTVTTLVSYGQTPAEKKCLDPDYHEKCTDATNSIFDDFVYLKSRPFSKDMSGELFELTLKQNTLYMFNICEGSESKATINLYNFEDTSTPIATTYNEATGKNTRLLSFYSQASGKYLISVSFKNSEAYCVVVVCGMIRKNIETYIKLPNQAK